MIIVLSGVNFDTGARNAFAGEMIFLSFDKNDFTIDSCMDGKIAAHESAGAGNLRSALLCRFLLVPPALTCDILLFP